MTQRSFPAILMRGGTSKALFFHRRDLPETDSEHNCEVWNEIFLSALGSPDPNGRQLNGMGGGESSLSKVAVIAPSTRPDADVDYTFAQVGIRDQSVGYKGNCGNISSAVGPFAVDEDLVKATGDSATVRIFNTNTSKLIHATFAVDNGKAAVNGDYVLKGVAGSGSPIRLSFMNPGGATTGRLLPTGSPLDVLDLDGGVSVEASLIDAANPVVCLLATSIGLTGSESPAELRENGAAMALFEQIRIASAVKMGLVENREEAEAKMKNLPLVALLADRAHLDASGNHGLEVRMISAGLPHGAIPLTGAMCLAIGAHLKDTLINKILLHSDLEKAISITHASGVIDINATVETVAGEQFAKEVTVVRTARKLMEGRVFLV